MGDAIYTRNSKDTDGGSQGTKAKEEVLNAGPNFAVQRYTTIEFCQGLLSRILACDCDALEREINKAFWITFFVESEMPLGNNYAFLGDNKYL